MTGQVTTDAWADSGTFGGQEFHRWEKEKKLTDKGLRACLGIVRRTTKNAFL
jgi:transposase InsO family protein